MESKSKIELYNEDCLERMPKIAEKSVDLILCDLPYGTTANQWDVLIPFDKLWANYNRIIKDNGAILLFSQLPFSIKLGASNMEMLKYEWIWVKNKPTGFLSAHIAPMKSVENILVFYKSLPTYNPQDVREIKGCCKIKTKSSKNYKPLHSRVTTTTGYPTNVLYFDQVNNAVHPTQKPVPLLEYLVKTYTNEGDTVLDNCMGSGSTGVACRNLNRNFIGIEMTEKYFKIAEERINDSFKEHLPDFALF